MTIPSRGEIDAMANIMRVLQGKTAEEEAIPEPVSESHQPGRGNPSGGMPSPTMLGTAATDKEAMKSVLLALRGVTESVIAPPAPYSTQIGDPALREAALTERTPRGVRIDRWEIVKNDARIPTYDVVSAETGMAIAKTLYVYEAALGLVRRLNEGVAINDPRVSQLLKLEENFVRNHTDANVFKERARKAHDAGDARRAAVLEDRQDQAVRSAETEMDEILKLAGLRR